MAGTANNTNYYEILEIDENAASHEVHKAYQHAKSTYSSDNPALYTMFSADEAREILRLVEEAYSVLGNSGLRKEYDEGRLQQLSTTPNTSISNSTYDSINQNSFVPTSPPVDSVHRHLPDLPLSPSASELRPSNSTSANFSTSAQPMIPGGKTHLPEGMGRTLLSTYKLDDSFEAELNGALEFDGTLLQRTRIYKNVSIDRLSEATRISRTYLMAVETNDYKSLPAAVFTRGFIVQIARILGLNDQKVASSYIKMFKAGGGK